MKECKNAFNQSTQQKQQDDIHFQDFVNSTNFVNSKSLNIAYVVNVNFPAQNLFISRYIMFFPIFL